jgi:predicted PurR-regulated permease PerM
VGASLLVLSALLVWWFRKAIPPFLVACVLAYILGPVVGWLQARLRLRRWAATLLVYLLLFGAVASALALLIPPLLDQLHRLDFHLRAIVAGIEVFLSQPLVIGGYSLDIRLLVEQTAQALGGLAEPVFGHTMGIAFEVITSFVWAVFILVISFYLVKDSAQLSGWVERLPPPAYRPEARRLRRELSAVWRAFFRGQIVLAGAVSVILTCVSLALGLPSALALGVLGGLLEFVPSLGHGLWLVIATLLVLSKGSSWLPIPPWAVAALLIALHLVFQQVDINVLIPFIVGRRVQLHPLVVILGIIAGALFAGVLGVILAAPTIASARVIGRYLFDRLLDIEPFGNP